MPHILNIRFLAKVCLKRKNMVFHYNNLHWPSLLRDYKQGTCIASMDFGVILFIIGKCQKNNVLIPRFAVLPVLFMIS